MDGGTSLALPTDRIPAALLSTRASTTTLGQITGGPARQDRARTEALNRASTENCPPIFTGRGGAGAGAGARCPPGFCCTILA